MPKTRKEEAGHGDWSSTGTFLRRPASGWLHEDSELRDDSSINYKISYLGCIEVRQSMRTLQYQVRTQVTKEAITRMAEISGKLSQGKKRKVPKQLNKLLGAVDTRWAEEVNFSISAECLRISNAISNRDIMNHSLPSISFASGGDGATIEFIGYVAKDPVHERACHVFHCVDCSQYVLATIGQAFELRYKMYLNSPHPQPLEVADTISSRSNWGDTPSFNAYSEGRRGGGEGEEEEGEMPSYESAPSPPFPMQSSPPACAGIYSDLPEFPSNATPPGPVPPPLSLVSDGRPRVYSKLPGFPTLEEEGHSYANGVGRTRLENPYDTMDANQLGRMEFSETGEYSNPGEITYSTEEGVYDNRMMTIKQMTPATSKMTDRIELTLPHPPRDGPVYGNAGIPTSHNYTNTAPFAGLPPLPPLKTNVPPTKPSLPPTKPSVHPTKPTLHPTKPSQPPTKPSQPPTKPSQPPQKASSPPIPRPRPRKPPQEATYDNTGGGGGQGNPRPCSNDYDDPDALEVKGPSLQHTPHGDYDNPDDVIAASLTLSDTYDDVTGILSKVNEGGGRWRGGGKGGPRGGGGGGRHRRDVPPPPSYYDDPKDIINSHRNGSAEGVATGNHYNSPEVGSRSRMNTPKFDDTIYAVGRDISSSPRGRGGAADKMATLNETQPGPCAPLPQQRYFHGAISRAESEALLEREGEFLVRESTKMAGQFVLTGMSPDGPQHLLLMDRNGKVKSKDHSFDSVPHLVQYFVSREAPLVIGGSQVYLKQAIVNAFPVTRH